MSLPPRTASGVPLTRNATLGNPDAPGCSTRGAGLAQVGQALLAPLLSASLLGGCGALPTRGPAPSSDALAPSTASALVRLAQASSPGPELSGFRLMPNGFYALDARLELARRAQRSLDVQYYHVHNDGTGRLLMGHRARRRIARGSRPLAGR